MNPCSIPARSSSTLASGASALVVQEAFETIVCTAGSYASVLTPNASVTSAPSDGALTSTFFARRVEVGAGGLGRGEAAGGFQDDVDAEFGPRQLRRFALGQHLDPTAVDDEDVPVDGHRAPEPAGRAVEGEQPGEGGGLGQVVDGDDLEGAVALQQCAQHIASDAAESVDGDASHEWCPFPSPHQARARPTSLTVAGSPWFARIPPHPYMLRRGPVTRPA
jgi:hypothetical protein